MVPVSLSMPTSSTTSQSSWCRRWGERVPGDPMDKDVNFGPVVSMQRHEKVLSYTVMASTPRRHREAAVPASTTLGWLLHPPSHIHRLRGLDADRARGNIRAGGISAQVLERGARGEMQCTYKIHLRNPRSSAPFLQSQSDD